MLIGFLSILLYPVFSAAFGIFFVVLDYFEVSISGYIDSNLLKVTFGDILVNILIIFSCKPINFNLFFIRSLIKVV